MVFVRKSAFQLFGLDGAEDFADLGAGGKSNLIHELTSVEEGLGDEGLIGEFFLFEEEEVVVVAEAIAAVAIDPVEFDLEGEGVGRHEALELGDAHVLDVHEAHVARDHEGDLVDYFIGVAEALEDDLSHFGSDFIVAVEAVAFLFLVPGLGGGLSDVVEEDGEAEIERGFVEEREGDAGVDVDVALGMPLRRLFTADEVEEFGEEDLGHAGIDEEVESAGAVLGVDDAGELVADALGGNFLEEVGVLAEGGEGDFFDLDSGLGGEADGAEEAEGVLLEAVAGDADGAEDAGFEVSAAADEVDDLTGEGVFEEAVHGEVPALGVFLGGGEDDGVGVAAVLIDAIGPESGDLDGVAIFFYEDDAEVLADGIASGEEGLDFLWGGGSGEIVILGNASEQAVTHRASCVEDGVSGIAQHGGSAEGEIGLRVIAHGGRLTLIGKR